MAYARHLQLATLDFMIGGTEPLPRPCALLAMAAAMTADGHFTETANVLTYVLQNHENAEAVREIIIQTHLFCGYPRTLNALEALRKAAERAEVDLSGLRGDALEPDLADAELLERGAALWKLVYGENADKIGGNARKLSPDLAHWSALDGYGRVLSRPGLDQLTRQMCIVAALIPLDVQPQLKGHIKGALNIGATTEQLWALHDTVRKLFEADRVLDAAKQTFEAVLGKRKSDLSLEEERRYQW